MQINAANLPEGLVLRGASSHTVLAVQGEAAVYFAHDVARVLNFYMCAAQWNVDIDIDAFKGAWLQIDALKKLAPKRIFFAVDAILQSDAPNVLSALLAEEALAHFGLPQPRSCLSALCTAPKNRLARWALLLKLCDAHPDEVVRALPMEQLLAVSPALLRLEGVRGPCAPRILQLLTQAVLRQPTLNEYNALTQMAHAFMRCR